MNQKIKKQKKPWKKRKKENKSKINSILSYVNYAFFILNNLIEHQAFRHTHCTIEKNVSFNVKKGPIQGSICFKLVPELPVPGPLSKVTLSTRVLLQFFSQSAICNNFFHLGSPRHFWVHVIHVLGMLWDLWYMLPGMFRAPWYL
jgi:hypothetical protein